MGWLAIDPGNTATIYAGTGAGVFKSTNGGESWNPLNVGASALAIDPITPTILYAAGNGVSKSTDGGASWHTINNGLANQNGTVLGVSELAIDPITPTTVYAGAYSRGVSKTTNGGTSWNTINNGLPIDPWGDIRVRALAIDPTNPNVIYASLDLNIPNSFASFPAIFKSTNGGANWSQIFSGFRVATFLTLLVIDPINPNTIYAGGYRYDCCGGVLLKSTNSGGSWSQSHLSGSVSVVAIDPTNPNIVYLGSGGLLKSTNGGQSWAALDGLTNLGVGALAIDPVHPGSVYAGTFVSGAFKSSNGGASWSAANTGLRAVNVGRLAVDPTDAQMIYAQNDAIATVRYKSVDNGGSWSANDFYPLAFDPRNPNVIYASVTGLNGLSKSTDGGATWSSANTGLENNYVSTLAVDPSNSEVIYAGTGGSLFKTTNGGASWSAIGNLLCPELLAIDPGNSQTLYAVAAYDCYDYCTTVYKSTDGGVNWIRDGGASFYYVSALVIDPFNPQIIYVSDNGGLAKSTDAGESWNAVIRQPGTSGVSSVVVDPVHPNVIYAGTYGDGVFRSADGGASWNPLNEGLTNLNINTLAIEASGEFLHAGTPAGVFDLQLSIPPQTNQIDDAQFFVRQHYLDFLNREPDAGGLAYWTNQITQCGSDARCIHSRRIGVSAAFFIELEFQDTGYYVDRFYKASFGRQPNYAEFTSDRSKVIGGSNLETNKQAFADEWVQRGAFVSAYPITLSNTEVVNKLFDSAGLTASIYDPQRQLEIQAMNAGRSRALVLRDVIEIPDFKNIPDPSDPRYNEIKQTSQYNPAFVLMQYFGYLHRDLDRIGYDFWLDVLNNREPNNYRGMVCSFLTSSEYQLRFGSSVTRSNADCIR